MKDLLKFDCRIIFAVIISVFCIVPQNINGAPAYPYPVEYKLPDGSDITILLKGDESVHWRESVDGYTILVNSEGFLEYAEEDENGNLKLSGVRASNENRRNDGKVPSVFKI